MTSYDRHDYDNFYDYDNNIHKVGRNISVGKERRHVNDQDSCSSSQYEIIDYDSLNNIERDKDEHIYRCLDLNPGDKVAQEGAVKPRAGDGNTDNGDPSYKARGHRSLIVVIVVLVVLLVAMAAAFGFLYFKRTDCTPESDAKISVGNGNSTTTVVKTTLPIQETTETTRESSTREATTSRSTTTTSTAPSTTVPIQETTETTRESSTREATTSRSTTTTSTAPSTTVPIQETTETTRESSTREATTSRSTTTTSTAPSTTGHKKADRPIVTIEEAESSTSSLPLDAQDDGYNVNIPSRGSHNETRDSTDSRLTHQPNAQKPRKSTAKLDEKRQNSATGVPEGQVRKHRDLTP